MISKELEVQVLRLHTVEKWPPGTIAAQLGVHHDVVERVIAQAGTPRVRRARPTMLDPYLDFVNETWTRYPKLTASRLWVMCRERGYPGAKGTFRHSVAKYRPKPRAEAYLRLRTLPGEQAQVDWAHFGKIVIGRAQRPLVAFVAVLSYSRAIFLHFFLGQQGENFLRGHVAAFSHWDGVARILLYDNLKSAVLERVGDAIRFHPTLLDLAAHYSFEPRPVAPGRGNEKGRVERAIRYVRSAFFLARKWRDIDDLNRQAIEWCDGEAMDRPWPEDTTIRVRDAFCAEREKLLPLPPDVFPADERRGVSVGKTPYVRFDTNDYSVPHEFVRKTLVVHASLQTVRVMDGTREIASHPRSFDKGKQIENPLHIACLVEEKRQARKHRAVDRLAHAAPSTRDLLVHIADRGIPLGRVTRKLLELLDTYGAAELEQATREVLQSDAPHVEGVQQVLERERRERGMPPALPVPLPADPRIRNLSVKPHALESYDQLAQNPEEKENDDDEEQQTQVAR